MTPSRTSRTPPSIPWRCSPAPRPRCATGSRSPTRRGCVVSKATSRPVRNNGRWLEPVAACLCSTRGVLPHEDGALLGGSLHSTVVDLGIVDSLVHTAGLLTCTPQPADSASAVIGFFGGTIQVGGDTLSVPAGALLDTVTITMAVPSDTVNH